MVHLCTDQQRGDHPGRCGPILRSARSESVAGGIRPAGAQSAGRRPFRRRRAIGADTASGSDRLRDRPGGNRVRSRNRRGTGLRQSGRHWSRLLQSGCGRRGGRGECSAPVQAPNRPGQGLLGPLQQRRNRPDRDPLLRGPAKPAQRLLHERRRGRTTDDHAPDLPPGARLQRPSPFGRRPALCAADA